MVPSWRSGRRWGLEILSDSLLRTGASRSAPKACVSSPAILSSCSRSRSRRGDPPTSPRVTSSVKTQFLPPRKKKERREKAPNVSRGGQTSSRRLARSLASELNAAWTLTRVMFIPLGLCPPPSPSTRRFPVPRPFSLTASSVRHISLCTPSLPPLAPPFSGMHAFVFTFSVPHLPLRQSPSSWRVDLCDAQKVWRRTRRAACVRACVRARMRARVLCACAYTWRRKYSASPLFFRRFVRWKKSSLFFFTWQVDEII